LAGFVNRVQCEYGFGRVEANAANLVHGRLPSWLL
jgi:hypothetical protein